MAHVKIRQDEDHIFGATIEVDGKQLSKVFDVNFNMNVDKVNTLSIKQYVKPDIECEAEVRIEKVRIGDIVNEDEYKVEYLKCEFDRVQIDPGDVIVLRTPNILSQLAIDHLTESLKKTFGPDVKAVCLEEGMSLGVIKKI